MTVPGFWGIPLGQQMTPGKSGSPLNSIGKRIFEKTGEKRNFKRESNRSLK